MPESPQPIASPASPALSPGGVPAGESSQVERLARRAIAANARLNAIAVVAVAVLIVLGIWVHSGIKRSLQEIRAAGLQAALEAQVKALRLWAEDKKQEAASWANEERVRRRVVELSRAIRAQASGAEALWAAPARAELVKFFAPVLQESGAVMFSVVDETGLVLATSVRDYVGRRVNRERFLPQLAAVFRGEPRFIRPYPERERVEGAAAAAPARALVWFEAPVRGERGEVVAALGIGHDASAQFVGILNVVRPGRTGEVYAFDERGMLLSESRFLPELQAADLVAREPEASSIFRVQVRDPGGDLAAGYQPELEPDARPLTRLAALAIASRHKPSAEERQGVILEPYRNYRGADVIGAWKWLADLDMGLAIEMGAGEAYAPLAYLNLASAVILSLLLAAAAAALWSTVLVRRLRREVGEARFVGQYRLERLLGEGGMGKVYLARHALLKRPTALKMLKPHLASDEIVTRFEREVQLASQLTHPNTIEIYDYGRTQEGVFYYVMEYLEGETLDRLVAAQGAMPVGRVLHVLRQVCAALREAHGQGLVHRDIKPHNIMLCRRGGEYDVVKMLDFGLVKDTGGRLSRDITQFQKLLGTPLYMSPERIRNPGDADVRSDIYSVGAVAFYLVTGRELFEAASDHDLTYCILHTPARRASELVPGVPRRLDELIARCLAKERAERPHDIVVVQALVEALSVEHPWTDRDAEACWRAPARALEPERRRAGA
ncbi:MAG TPA: protein kinase [Burkholderiales bacterium]|nr:protein kinase [Burkholderiales bacterium]